MTSPQRVPFRPADLAQERLIQQLAVAPDGALAAYAVRSVAADLQGYRCHLVVLDLASREVVHRTDGAVRDGLPAFAADGRSLVFVSDRAGAAQAFRLRLDTCEIEQLTDLPMGVRSAEPSPDDQRLLVLAPSGVERFRQGDAPVARVVRDLTWRADGVGVRDQFTSAWEVRLADGAARRLTDPTYEVLGARWRGGGEEICVVADLSESAALDELPQAHVLRPGEVMPRSLAALPGMVCDVVCGPAGQIALIGVTEPGAPFWAWARVSVHLLVADGICELALPQGVTATNATFGDFIDPSAVFAPQACWLDETRLVVVGGQRGRAHPYVLGIDGGCERLGGEDLVCYRVAAGGGRLACVACDEGGPADVHVLDGDELRPLGVEGAWAARWRLAPRRFAWRSPELERPDGWLVESESFEAPGPLVVHVHGGPYAAHGPAPWLEMVALADAGIAVLYLNPPGSLGYGVDYARRLTGAWGAADEEHVLAAIDAAVAAGVADPARVGVMGLSYGGFMTLWLLGRHPDRFVAAVCENPPADFVSWAATSDLGTMAGPRGIDLGTLPEDAPRYHAASALAQLGDDVPPLLLLQSEADLRCPAVQTEIVFGVLRRRGCDVAMVRYPDEPHGMALVGRPDRRIDRIERIVAFFSERLALATPAAEPATAGVPG